MVEETGIIMSGDHPKLILDLLKTMTRRTYGLVEINKNPDEWLYLEGSSPKGRFTFHNKQDNSIVTIKCPYGQVGDRLWVRETWATDKMYDDRKPSEIPLGEIARTYYKDDPLLKYGYAGKWRPSLFIPKVASRILLEITGLRAERVQEITEEDAKAEGIIYPKVKGSWHSWVWAFKDLWNSLNAKRGYGWLVNPWVWVILFKLVI